MTTRRPPGEAAIDRWLMVNLRDQHQAVMREPIPDALTKLLAGDQGS